MVGPVSPVSQMNFDPNNLPPNTADFYNTASFASNEIGFLGNQVSQEQQAQENGLQQIKNAINGES